MNADDAGDAISMANTLRDPAALAEAGERLRRVLPPEYVDQLAAAASHATSLIHERLGPGMMRALPGSFPEWLLLGMTATTVAWRDGRAKVCPCNPSVTSPEPIVAAAWLPNAVTCFKHKHMLGSPVRCDACGTEPGDAAGLQAGVIGTGVLIYAVALCPACARELLGGLDSPATLPPGGAPALARGCICPVCLNNRGEKAPLPPDGWYLAPGCPVHLPGVATTKPPTGSGQ